MMTSVVLITDSVAIAGLVHGACVRDDLVILSAVDLLQGRMLAELARPAAILCAGDFALAEAVLTRAAAIWGGELAVLGESRMSGVTSVAAERPAIAEWLATIEAPPRDGPADGDMLAQVRARYADSLGEKAAALVTEIDAALAQPDDAVLREASCRLAHRLRGSAGSYGFPAFGEVAATIDDLLRGPFTAGDIQALQGLRRRLALWENAAEPFAADWPIVSVIDESPEVVGEIAVAAAGVRARVRAAACVQDARGALCLVVSAVVAEEASRHGVRAPLLVLGAAEVLVFEGAAGASAFPRRELAGQLPRLVAKWLDRHKNNV